MNRHPALVIVTEGTGTRHYLLDVPPDLLRLVPSGVPGARTDCPYRNTGVLACDVGTHEVVELWTPAPTTIVTP